MGSIMGSIYHAVAALGGGEHGIRPGPRSFARSPHAFLAQPPEKKLKIHL